MGILGILGILLIPGFFGNRVLLSAYLPNKRILNFLGRKEIIINNSCSLSLPNELKTYADISFIIKKVLKDGNISFSGSLTRKKPFPIYKILYKDIKTHKIYAFYIENKKNKI
ncbi:MAG: hypothetical protein ACFIN5_01245 [Candidatus Walczuchella monophlebidarum]